MLNYSDMITTEMISGLTRLSEITGFSSNVLVSIFALAFLFFILGLVILLKLRRIAKALLDINLRLDALAQRLTRHPQQSTTVPVNKDMNTLVPKEEGENLKSMAIKNAAKQKKEKAFSFMTGNSDLKGVLFDLVNNADAAISLQDLVSHLSEDYFDGNYHPIIHELNQLELEKKIEGQSINGKVFFQTKSTETWSPEV